MRKSIKLILAGVMVCFAIMAVSSNCVLADDAVEQKILTKVKQTKLLILNTVIPLLEQCREGVPKTGQTTKYEDGDDGDLQKGTAWPNPRFTNNDDGTVTDNMTGLMWTEDANIYGTKIWSEALSDCASCTVGGYDDWRLPNINELESLLHRGVYDPAVPDTAGTGKWSEGNPFTDVQSSDYWSATTYAAPADNVWGVHMYRGDVSYDNTCCISFHVWPVRAGQ